MSHRLSFAPALALAALPLLPGCSPAAAADGAGVAARIMAARPGSTIRLAPGDYGVVTLANKRFAQPVTIDASQARFTGLVLTRVDGLTLRGGTVTGPGGRSYGIKIDRSSHIRVENMTLTGAHRGIVANMSTDLAFVGNRFTGLISDGLDVALSQRVLIERNSCRDFNYRRPVFDAAGVRLQDGDHPDCIQLWPRPTAAPVADVRIVGNDVEGVMQGILLNSKVRNGVDDGGFDRITITGNRVRVSFPIGISLIGARDSVVRDNRVETLPGARSPKPPYPPLKANLLVQGERNIVCGNVVTAVPNAPGTRPCR